MVYAIDDCLGRCLHISGTDIPTPVVIHEFGEIDTSYSGMDFDKLCEFAAWKKQSCYLNRVAVRVESLLHIAETSADAQLAKALRDRADELKMIATSIYAVMNDDDADKVTFDTRPTLKKDLTPEQQALVHLGDNVADNPDGDCFELQHAKLLADGPSAFVERVQDSDVLGLRLRFARYSQEALDFLAKHPPEGGIASIDAGFHHLSPDGAKALTQLQVASSVELRSLIQLDAEVAAALSFSTKKLPLLVIGLQSPLATEAAEALVLSREAGEISLSLPSLNDEVATALCRHTGYLHLDIRSEPLTVSTAEILAYHKSFLLWIDLGIEPSPLILQALSCNPAMQMVNIGYGNRLKRYRFVISLPENFSRSK